jgi:hypothetical protein
MISSRSHSCEVAVIGAGPYGLSVAAHLKHAGVSTHVFGDPMAFWRHNMPKGMLLRSPWRATHLSDPAGALSLDAYASEQGVDSSKLLPVEEFVAYGAWFARHAVPDIDRRAVRLIDTAPNGFRLTLADGEVLSADRVVIATGLRNQEYRPPLLRDLPAALVTHSCQHTDFSQFRGQRVGVIGRGKARAKPPPCWRGPAPRRNSSAAAPFTGSAPRTMPRRSGHCGGACVWRSHRRPKSGRFRSVGLSSYRAWCANCRTKRASNSRAAACGRPPPAGWRRALRT